MSYTVSKLVTYFDNLEVMSLTDYMLHNTRVLVALTCALKTGKLHQDDHGLDILFLIVLTNCHYKVRCNTHIYCIHSP